MRFTKMHGIGNDYIYVDCFRNPPPADPAALSRADQRPALRRRRRRADPDLPVSETADARMRMFNADGSEAEMCGNGLRCVAKYVYDHGIARKPRLTIETGRGVLTVDLEVEERQGRAASRVNMGEPILKSADDPDDAARRPAGRTRRSTVGGHARSTATCVSMGNPHASSTSATSASTDDATWSPSSARRSSTHPAFPRRVNVHFVKVHSPSEVTMRTWERGSGNTLACGTGACAVCVAGVLTGRTERKLARPPARRRPGTGMVGSRQPRLQDRPGDRSVHRRVARVTFRVARTP